MTTFKPENWQARLSDALRARQKLQASRKTEAAEKQRRRDYGLAQRHARKTARNQAAREQSS